MTRFKNVPNEILFQLQKYSSYPGFDSQPAGLKARKKVTLQTLRNMYKSNEPITMITAHDYPSGLFVERAGIDMCLVGDSLAMVALGYENTNKITLDMMIHHCNAVARGCKAPFLVGDLPFGTYERGPDQALVSSIRYIQEGQVEAVKLEGGVEMVETIRKITSVGIPVLGHIGLTPQRQSSLSGYRVQGKSLDKVDTAKDLLIDAEAVQEAGCFAIVLEAIPSIVAKVLTETLNIPTIGIGAGVGCSGQVLVQNDAIGVFDKFLPKFCKQYAKVNNVTVAALEEYKNDVKSKNFPNNDTHGYQMSEGEEKKFREWLIQKSIQ
ncbi:hypothetical protein HK096_010620 [Nowakowskiella sp. JEL0078]|nr:hypothetical protein HK096_010620 [Nowakowskiella sp. JEL0078]